MPRHAALRAVAVAAVALALLTGLAGPALAQTTGAQATTTATTTTDPNAAVPVPRMDVRPPGRRLTGEQVQRIAQRVPKIRRETANHRGSFPNVYTKGPGRWQVSFFTRGTPAKEFAQV
ncbi:MAG: hypothetical protein QOF04_1380, partial [Solirubrobacteraceae bacterium]|nr:hypothetical protein [Solirubrobacteraceae bacterium]